jgi:hypothetical protein
MSEQKTDYATRGKTIFRVEKNKDNPFVMIDRRPIENPALSWRAKGVLTYLVSRPDNWIVRLGDLVKRSPEGVYAVRAALKELTKAGHITRREEREEGTGRFKQYVLEVHEIPVACPPTNPPQAAEPQAVDLTLNDTESVNETDSLTDITGENLEILKKAGLEWMILAGKEVTQEMIDSAIREKSATAEFERAFKFGTLPWSSNAEWTKFEKFIVKIYSADPGVFKDYAAWREDGGKYGKAMTNLAIRRSPQAFMDTGYPTFEASKMCAPSAPAINEVVVEKTKQAFENKWDFVPAPPPPNLTKPVLKTPERRVRR